MASPDINRVKAIFAEALAWRGADRDAYLDRACANDAELRAEVEAYLSAAENNGITLGTGMSEITTPYIPLAERPGTTIGRYKLLEQIGEGGFGVVFMAEQEQPIRRRVALKIIKLGMDTKQVVARFEAERQALAIMDHPNIAKVLDAGATGSGRPYFVMELVRGTPITEFSDKNHLNIHARLELFVQACQAVQHAHQKGLIHRDIKPSNVLVCVQEDRPAIKVIDFGIAKAMQAPLTEKTLFTQFDQMIGTPQYMSPEQTGGSLDIDTRSDVYSLGVLLYQLLTGSSPFDAKELAQIALEEIKRIIREIEPPVPSTRISTLVDLPSVAACRGIEPRELGSILRGELDCIAMKCLEKERCRRYETAAALARDVERYLRDEPVEASPPSMVYRFRKFARKHKAAIYTTAFCLLLLILGTVISVWQAVRATRAESFAANQRDAAIDAKKSADQQLKIASSTDEFLIRDVLGRARIYSNAVAGGVEKELMLHDALDRAAPRVASLFKDQPEVRAAIELTLGRAYMTIEAYPEAKQHLETAVQMRRELFGAEDPRTLLAMVMLARVDIQSNRVDATTGSLLHEALNGQQKKLGEENPQTLTTLEFIAMYETFQDNWDTAGQLFERVYEARRRVLGPSNEFTLGSLENLAVYYANRGPYAKAKELFEQLIRKDIEVFGPEDPATLRAKGDFADLYRTLGQYADAEKLLQNTLAVQLRVLGEQHPQSFASREFLAQIHAAMGHIDQATDEFVQLTKLRCTDSWAWSCAGMLLAFQQKPNDYRDLCNSMGQMFLNDPSNVGALLETRLIDPDPSQVPQLLGTARQDVKRLLAPGDAATASDRDQLSWAYLHQAIALYRAQQYQQCLESLDQCKTIIAANHSGNFQQPCADLANLLTAMSEQRLGRIDDAKLNFLNARETLDKISKLPIDPQVLQDYGLANWLLCQLFLREAGKSIEISDQKENRGSN